MRFKIIGFLTASLTCGIAFGQLEPCRNNQGLYGFCDKTGKAVIDYQFFDALEFIDGHAAVLKEDKWGIINESGNWMVQPVYDEVYNCTNLPDQILVMTAGKWSLVNAYGIQMTHEYEVGSPWYEFDLDGQQALFNANSWFAVIKKGKWGVIDVNDQVKIPFQFEWARVLRRPVDGVKKPVSVITKRDGKYAWQRLDAQAATGYDFDQFMGEYDDFLFFRKGNTGQIINSITGETVRDAGRPYFNLIDAEDSAGLVNSVGRIIVPFKYRTVDISRVQMHAVVGEPYALGLMDLSGKMLLEPIYQDIREITSSPALVAVKNTDGKVAVFVLGQGLAEPLTEFKYDYAIDDGGRIRMKIGNRFGYLTYQGEESWND